MIIEVDAVEVEFQKQHPEVSCNWCVYVKVRKGLHEKILLMIKTDNIPFTNFTHNQGNIITNTHASNVTKLCQ